MYSVQHGGTKNKFAFLALTVLVQVMAKESSFAAVKKVLRKKKRSQALLLNQIIQNGTLPLIVVIRIALTTPQPSNRTDSIYVFFVGFLIEFFIYVTR